MKEKDTKLEAELRLGSKTAGGRSFVLNVSFVAYPGVTVIFGPSGSGKTTILDCIAGLRRPDFGCITLCEQRIFDTDKFLNVPTRARRLGYVFHDLALFPHLSVEENVGFGLQDFGSAQRRSLVSEILTRFHISHLRREKPGRISGGERQRVALARSLVTEPRALLLDEPLSALDYATKSKIMADLLAWNESRRIPVLYVTHAIEEAFTLGRHVVRLRDGKIVDEGSPSAVLSEERDYLIARLESRALDRD